VAAIEVVLDGVELGPHDFPVWAIETLNPLPLGAASNETTSDSKTHSPFEVIRNAGSFGAVRSPLILIARDGRC
jgi:hypothetical protein